MAHSRHVQASLGFFRGVWVQGILKWRTHEDVLARGPSTRLGKHWYKNASIYDTRNAPRVLKHWYKNASIYDTLTRSLRVVIASVAASSFFRCSRNSDTPLSLASLSAIRADHLSNPSGRGPPLACGIGRFRKPSEVSETLRGAGLLHEAAVPP
jgi:hypothetical protein